MSNITGKTALITVPLMALVSPLLASSHPQDANLILPSRSEGEIKTLYQLKREGKVTSNICWKECDIANQSIVGEIIESLLKEFKAARKYFEG